MTVGVRPSRDADAALILDVVEDAFNGPEHDAKEEVDIVRSTWTVCQPPRLLELVAHDGRNLVGHVMAAPGMLGWASGPHSPRPSAWPLSPSRRSAKTRASAARSCTP